MSGAGEVKGGVSGGGYCSEELGMCMSEAPVSENPTTSSTLNPEDNFTPSFPQPLISSEELVCSTGARAKFFLPTANALLGSQRSEMLSVDPKEALANLIISYSAEKKPDQRAQTAHAIALMAKMTGEELLYQEWSSRALSDAEKIPNGKLFAIPMMAGDQLALDGKYFEASKRYRMAMESLKPLASKDSEIARELRNLQARHKGVLMAGVAHHTQELEIQPSDETRSRAMALADQIYLSDPTEENLEVVYQSYARVGLDIKKLKDRIRGNEASVEAYYQDFFRPSIVHKTPMGLVTLSLPGPDQRFMPRFGMPGSQDLLEISNQMGSEMHVKMAESENKLLGPMVQVLESRFLGLVERAHKDSNFQRHVGLSKAQLLMGDNQKARIHLEIAAETFHTEKVPHTRDNLVAQVTVLHRLVSFKTYTHFHEELTIAREAASLLGELKLQDPQEAALLKAENLELTAEINQDILKDQLRGGEIEEEAYQAALRKGYQDIVDHCEEALSTIRAKEPQEVLAGKLMDAAASLYEHDLGVAQVKYLQDDKDEARGLQMMASMMYNATRLQYEPLLSPQVRGDTLGRADLAEAYYDFKTGQIEDSLRLLQGIVTKYPDSMAARVIRQKDNWPSDYGIVDETGNFSADIHKPSFVAGLKTAVGQLVKEQGRGLIACGIGAAAYAGLDIVFGEKISGAGVILACTGAYAVDRAFVVAEASDEISSSYRSGVSNVSTSEAVMSGALFAVNIASMYFGGVIGGLAQKGALTAGTFLESRAMSFLVSRGVQPGPWVRGLSGFAIREGAYVANAAAFHKATGLVNEGIQKMQDPDAPPPEEESHGLFVSWLFVRVMPFAEGLNVGGRIIKGDKFWDGAARKGINTAFAGTTVQLGVSAAEGDFSHFSNHVAGLMIDLPLIHLGNQHVMKRMFPIKTVGRMNDHLDAATRRNIERTQATIASEPDPVDWLSGKAANDDVEGVPDPNATRAEGMRSRRMPPPAPKLDPEATRDAGIDRKVVDVPSVSPYETPLDLGVTVGMHRLMEYVDVPAHTETLGAFCRDSGPWGSQARQFRDGLQALKAKAARYETFQKVTDPASQMERGRLAREIEADYESLDKSWYTKNIMDPYIAKVREVQQALLPVKGAIASVEVRANAQRHGKWVRYETRFTPAEELGGQFENGYARVKLEDMVTVDVEVSDWATANEVVQKIRGATGLTVEHNTDLAAVDQGNTGKNVAVRLLTGQMVEVRIRLKVVAEVAPTDRYQVGQTYRIPLRDIIPTQGGVYLEGERGRHRGVLDRAVTAAQGGPQETPTVRIIDGKMYVSDGHHRLMMEYALGNELVEVKIEGPDPDGARLGLKPVLAERATTWDAVKWRDAQGRPMDAAVARQRVVAAVSAKPVEAPKPNPLQSLEGLPWRQVARRSWKYGVPIQNPNHGESIDIYTAPRVKNPVPPSREFGFLYERLSQKFSGYRSAKRLNIRLRMIADIYAASPADIRLKIEARLKDIYTETTQTPESLARSVYPHFRGALNNVIIQHGSKVGEVPIHLDTDSQYGPDKPQLETPGSLNYYTSREGLERILKSGRIEARAPIPGRQKKVYLASVALSPSEVERNIFIGNRAYKGKGNYVISFDFLTPRAVQYGAQIATSGGNPVMEMFVESSLVIGKDIVIRYAGENPILDDF